MIAVEIERKCISTKAATIKYLSVTTTIIYTYIAFIYHFIWIYRKLRKFITAVCLIYCFVLLSLPSAFSCVRVCVWKTRKWKKKWNAGLMAPVPGMVAPGLMLPGPPMMQNFGIPRFRWSAHGPLYMTAARANHHLANANPPAIAPISVIYTQLPQPQLHHETLPPHILKQLQL